MFYLLILLLQMKLIREINDLNKAIKGNRELGFVPTMGGLHKGHESLVKISKKKCKKTLVSIFVNPKQFNSINDYKSYPKNLNKDLKILKKLKVDYVFLPSVNQIYKNEKLIKFKLKESQKILCAKYRKGHFEGVLDIMNRFINIIIPKYVFMGEKDFQQYFLVREFLEQTYKTKIILCNTIRDNNMVALSSRNYLLDKNNLNVAGIIAKQLISLKTKINQNKKKNTYLIKNIKKDLTKKFNIKIEYLDARNTINLKSNIIYKKFKLFIAYYIKNVRLIDNF
jgi:pantoate--beta-alanine ligase